MISVEGSCEDNRGLGVNGTESEAAFGSQQDLNWDQTLALDMNMVDLLQEGNFDSLMDLFGQQYPTF
jgi:hypothetical protein